uniref:UPAR/Ly6 domain-containing protein n=1 Tax=Clytia hemisphaerica TaxID=252671 RepID=A0A7M5UV59_9CNID
MQNDQDTIFLITWLNCQDKVFTLQCYQCHADVGSSCDPRDKVSCAANEICVTKSYKELFEGEVIPNFVKGCGNGWDKCDTKCDDDTWYDCKQSCCRGNLCNEESNEKALWYALSSKNTYNSGNAVKSNMCLLVVSGVMLFVFKLGFI